MSEDASVTDRSLPTGVKTFLLLSLALLPLAVVAILAALDQARDAEEARMAEVELVADIGARHLAGAIDDAERGLRTAIDAASEPDFDCESDARMPVGLAETEARIAIAGADGELLCNSPDFALDGLETGNKAIVADRPNEQLIIVQRDESGAAVAAIALTRAALTMLRQPAQLDRNVRVTLSIGDEIFTVREWSDPVPGDQAISAERQVGTSDLRLSASFARRSLTQSEIIGIAMPIAAWLIGAVIGWIAITQLLLKPLGALRRAVIRHGEDDCDFALPRSPIAAVEIRQLGAAFEGAFASLQRHEDQLEAGLKEQTRLTREVHHRVKNNLQIIASLLSLHARAAKSDDSAAAYASIQRRVDALSIVQRNLFAELDAESGVAIQPVVAELVSGLQQGAPQPGAIEMALDIDPVRVGQDIAAPVAFLITELVELAMLSNAEAHIALSIKEAAPGRAQLTVRSAALERASERAEFDRYRRVLTGLARQLQAVLDEEDGGATFTIAVPILSEPKNI